MTKAIRISSELLKRLIREEALDETLPPMHPRHRPERPSSGGTAPAARKQEPAKKFEPSADNGWDDESEDDEDVVLPPMHPRNEALIRQLVREKLR